MTSSPGCSKKRRRMSSEEAQRLLDPSSLAKISGLIVRARMIVEGSITGLHRSPFHGSSVEFAEHREYVPGDDIRYIDWKVFGRSDRYYIKQFEEETNLRVQLVLDASESMAYGSGFTRIPHPGTTRCSGGTSLRREDSRRGSDLAEQKPPPGSGRSSRSAIGEGRYRYRRGAGEGIRSSQETMSHRSSDGSFR